MKYKKLLLIFLVLSVVSTASATTISQENIIIDLENSTVQTEIHIGDLTTESFNYQTSHPVQNLQVQFNGEKKECSVNELAFGTEIDCETDLKQDFDVKLNYETSGLVTSQSGVQKFSYSQSIYRPIRNYSLKVILPEGTGIIDSSNVTTPVIHPSEAELGNMDGRRFYVEWNTQPDLGTSQFQLMFESFERKDKESILPALLALALIAGIGLIVYRRKNKVEASSILKELSSDEKMVVELLQDNNGEMLQKDIVDKSDYSKAKISGVIGSLEENKVVSKEKEGRSNKVFLEEKFRE